MSNFGKCTIVVEGNAVNKVNDFIIPLCGNSEEYVYGRCFNVQSKVVDNVLYVQFEFNWDIDILAKVIEICKDGSGKCYYNFFTESMMLNSESNDEEGKYFTKYEEYLEEMECDYVCFEAKFEFENL
jgi:hypothetical protein